MKIKFAACLAIFLLSLCAGAQEARPPAEASAEPELAVFIENLEHEFSDLGGVLKYYKEYDITGGLIPFQELDLIQSVNKKQTEEVISRINEIIALADALDGKEDKDLKDFETLGRRIYEAGVELNKLETVTSDFGLYDRYNFAVAGVHKFLAGELRTLNKENISAASAFLSAKK